MHVAGCDLVRKIPQSVVNSNGIDQLFAVIPANPCYWGGTRIAQIAPGYQQYRPIEFSYEYVPQVAVTQQGTVTIGTLWCTSVEADDLQQTLVTSNGGQLTQCYNCVTGTVKLGSNLQYNLFNTSGWLGPETNPFTLVAGEQGAGVVPGYFMISYHYVFKNPVGQSWAFDSLWESDLGQIPDGQYVSAVTLTQSESYGPGTVLQYKDGEWTRLGDPLPEVNAPVPAAVFVCTSIQSEPGPEPDPTPPPAPPSVDGETSLDFRFDSIKVAWRGGGGATRLLDDVYSPVYSKVSCTVSDGKIYTSLPGAFEMWQCQPFVALVVAPGRHSWTALLNASPVYPFWGDSWTFKKGVRFTFPVPQTEDGIPVDTTGLSTLYVRLLAYHWDKRPGHVDAIPATKPAPLLKFQVASNSKGQIKHQFYSLDVPIVTRAGTTQPNHIDGQPLMAWSGVVATANEYSDANLTQFDMVLAYSNQAATPGVGEFQVDKSQPGVYGLLISRSQLLDILGQVDLDLASPQIVQAAIRFYVRSESGALDQAQPVTNDSIFGSTGFYRIAYPNGG